MITDNFKNNNMLALIAVYLLFYPLFALSVESGDQNKFKLNAEKSLLHGSQLKMQYDSVLGERISVFDDLALVSASYSDDDGTNSGKVYVMQRQADNSWKTEHVLKSDSPHTYDRFGESIELGQDIAFIGSNHGLHVFKYQSTSDQWVKQSISLTGVTSLTPSAIAYDGTHLFVGYEKYDGNAINQGAVFVLTESSNNHWTLVQTITASDASFGGYFGSSLSIDETSSKLLVGSFYRGENHAGGAYVLTFDGNQWVNELILEPYQSSNDLPSLYFGQEVVIQKNSDSYYLVVSSSTLSSNYVGAVYVFEINLNGQLIGNWKLRPQVQTLGVAFGVSIDISGDLLLIGAPGTDSNAGAAYVYQRSGNDWNLLQTIQNPALGNVPRFGRSMSFNINSGVPEILVGSDWAYQQVSNVGLPFTGAMSNYLHNGTFWSKQADNFAKTDYEDEFGFLMSGSGKTVAVGAPMDDEQGENAGAVYVFDYNDFNGNWELVRKLFASDAKTGDEFGRSVDFDGNRIVVGAPKKDRVNSNAIPPIFDEQAGAVYAFEKSDGIWQQSQKFIQGEADSDFHNFGKAVSVLDDRIAIGAYGDDETSTLAGAVIVFDYDPVAQNWIKTKLTPPPPHEMKLFGFSLDLGVDRLLVGAPYDSQLGTNSGAAFVFEYNNDGYWEYPSTLSYVLPTTGPNNFYGSAVSLDGNKAAIGGPGVNNSTGEVMIFETLDSGASWSFVKSTLTYLNAVVSDDIKPGDRLGESVKLENNRLLVGAASFDITAPNHIEKAGRAYFINYNDSDAVTELYKQSFVSEFDYFGFAVDIFDQFIMVGSQFSYYPENNGRVFSYMDDLIFKNGLE